MQPLSIEHPYLYPFITGLLVTGGIWNVALVLRKGRTIGDRLMNLLGCCSCLVMFVLAAKVESIILSSYMEDHQVATQIYQLKNVIN
jgi:hypothetical protein